MKNKIYKKIGLLSISALAALSFSTQVKAEQVCEDVEYANYYFFSGIYTDTKLDELIENKSYNYNGTFFPKLTEKAKDTVEKKVCLSADEADSACLKNDLNLNNFYALYKNILKANQEKSFSVTYTGVGGAQKTETTKVLYLTEGKTTYYLHDKWYTTDKDQNVTSDTSNKIVRYQSIDTADLVSGAVIPTETTFTQKDAGDEALMINIARKFNAGDKTGKTGFDLTDYYADGKTFLTPALYKITYKINECKEKEEEPDEPTTEDKFTATIKYLDKDTEKAVADQYSEKDLSNGYKKTVDSPNVDGCKLVNEDEVQVSYVINNGNFEKIVYYSCEVDDPGKTGNVLIFVAWVVGLSALGYSVYWFKKNKPEEVE